MNHPTREEWMAYLYHETPRSDLAALEQHLRSCPACEKAVADWQKAMRGLRTWRLPKRASGLSLAEPLLKWGIAALFAVGLGYGLGRFSAPTLDVETLRAGIENSLRASLAREIPAQVRQYTADEMKASWANLQAQWRQSIEVTAANAVAESSEQTQQILSACAAALKNLDQRLTQQDSDLTVLRKDAETVAVLTEYGFRRNQQQMVRLATYNQPTGPSAQDLRPPSDR